MIFDNDGYSSPTCIYDKNLSSFVTKRNSGDSLEPFVKHFCYFLVSCICFSWSTSTNRSGEILHQLNLSMFEILSSSRIFVNLDVPRWCMEVEQAIVNFCTDCVIKFPLFTCQFWKQIFAFPWWIGIFLLCWSLFCLCFSLCDFIWINAAIDWRHEIESTGFPLPFCFYE